MDKNIVLNDLTDDKDLQRLKGYLQEAFRDLDVMYTETAPNGTISAKQGTISLYNNSGTYTVWVNTDGDTTWQQIDSDTSTFHGLSDTPASYSGQAGKYAKVNSGETALEFGTVTGLQAKIGSFSRDTSLASGDQPVAGVGFQPSVIIFLSCQDTAVGESSIGFDIGTAGYALIDYHNITGSAWATGGGTAANAVSIRSYEVVGKVYSGYITTLGSDGFTITWTRTGTPTGTLTIYYLALR